MFLLDDILLAPLKGVLFVGEKIDEMVQKEEFDEGKIKERLLALQLKLELGEIGVEEYDKQEEVLLNLIERVRVDKEKE